MGKFFDFQSEEGESYQVRFEILEDRKATRPYGIRAEIFREGILVEGADAPERFLTRAEVNETIEMLCRFQVTPCTLCDII